MTLDRGPSEVFLLQFSLGDVAAKAFGLRPVPFTAISHLDFIELIQHIYILETCERSRYNVMPDSDATEPLIAVIDFNHARRVLLPVGQMSKYCQTD